MSSKTSKTQISCENAKKKEMDIYDLYRPHSGIRYYLSQTEIDLNAGVPKIHLKNTTVEYEPGQDLTTPPVIEQEEIKYSKQRGRGPVWKFLEEIQEAKQEKRSKALAETLKAVYDKKAKKKKQAQGGLHHKIIKMIGPAWYHELSNKQMNSADDLKEALLKDYKNKTIINTQETLGNLGLVLWPNHTKVEYALKKFYNCPVEFLLTLFRLNRPKEPEKGNEYTLNDRILLSAVVHLTMRDTMKELHLRIPSPPRKQHEPRKRPKKPKVKKHYSSPYLTPFPFIPQVNKEGIYKNKHKEYPSIRYFDYVDDMYDVYYEEVQPTSTKRSSKNNKSKWAKPPDIPVRYIKSKIPRIKKYRLKKPSAYISPCEEIKIMMASPKKKRPVAEDTYIINTEINFDNICNCSPNGLKDATFDLNIKITTSNEEITLKQKLCPFDSKCVVGEMEVVDQKMIEKRRVNSCNCGDKGSVGTKAGFKKIEYRCECCKCKKSVDIFSDCNCNLESSIISDNNYCKCNIQKILMDTIQKESNETCNCEPNTQVVLKAKEESEETCTCDSTKEENVPKEETTKCRPSKDKKLPVILEVDEIDGIEEEIEGEFEEQPEETCECKTNSKRVKKYVWDWDDDDLNDPYFLCTCQSSQGSCNCGGQCCKPNKNFLLKLRHYNNDNGTNLYPCRCKDCSDTTPCCGGQKEKCKVCLCTKKKKIVEEEEIEEEQEMETDQPDDETKIVECVPEPEKIEPMKSDDQNNLDDVSSEEEICSCAKIYDKYVTSHNKCVNLFDLYQEKMKEDIEEYMKDIKENQCNCGDSVASKKEEENEVDINIDEEDEDDCNCADKLAKKSEDTCCCSCQDGLSDNGCTCNDFPGCNCEESSSSESSAEDSNRNIECHCAEFAQQLNKQVKKSSVDVPDINILKQSITRQTTVAEEVVEEESDVDSNVNSEEIDPRIIVLKKFPKNEDDQMQLLKKALSGLAKDGYPLAQLPECHRLPHFRVWLDKRSGKYISMEERDELLELSRTYWNHIEMCRRKVSLPDLKLSPAKQRKMTWGAVYKYKRMITETKTDYYRRLKQAYISEAQEMFPTTFHYQLPAKTFRDCYFAYLPSDENHLFVFKPWQTRECKDTSKRVSCMKCS